MLAYLQKIVENKLKLVQYHITAKAVYKKLIIQKGAVITIKGVIALFQAREKSKL